MEAYLGHLGINEIIFIVSLKFRIHQLELMNIELEHHELIFMAKDNFEFAKFSIEF